MKRLLSFIMALMLVVLPLTACGDDPVGGNETGNGDIFDPTKTWNVYPDEHLVTGPVEINFWSANSAVDISGKTMGELVDEFNAYQKEKYPTSFIKVNVSFQGGYAVQNTKLQAALMGGNNPEIAQVGVSSLPLYADAAMDQREIFTLDQLRDVLPGFLQYAMYQGKFVGYPYFASTNILAINRTLLEATGMKIPTVEEIIADPENSIWTWEYMKEVAVAVTNLTDENPDNHIYGFAAKTPALYEMMYSQGVPIYNETATEALFNNEQGRKGFEYWRSLVVDKAMLNPVLDPNHGTRIQGAFSQGKVGMLSDTSAVITNYYTNVVKNREDQGQEALFELDVLPFPKGTNFYANQSGGSLIVFNNKSNNKTMAAVEFLRWLQAPEQSAKFSLNVGYLPTTNAARQTDLWKNNTEIRPYLDKVSELMRFTPPEGVKLPFGRAKALADSDFADYVKGIWLDDCTRDIDAVLKECFDRVNYVLAANSQ